MGGKGVSGEGVDERLGSIDKTRSWGDGKAWRKTTGEEPVLRSFSTEKGWGKVGRRESEELKGRELQAFMPKGINFLVK